MKTMKTIEYPIKEIVSIEMDENKIWWLDYNREHECFPQPHKRINKKHLVEDSIVGHWVNNKKGYRDFVTQTNKFCEEHNFLLEFGWSRMVNKRHECVSWSDKNVIGNQLPSLLFPKVILEGRKFDCLFERDGFFGVPFPYYNCPHYEKYIEDNNGECPLPLPEDVKWWEV